MRRQHQTLGLTLFVRVSAFSPAPQGPPWVLSGRPQALGRNRRDPPWAEATLFMSYWLNRSY